MPSFKKFLAHLSCAGKTKKKSLKKRNVNRSTFHINLEDDVDEPGWQLNKTRSMSHDCVFRYGSSFCLAGTARDRNEEIENSSDGGELVINNTYLCRSAYENYGFIDSLMRREKSLSSLYETIPENSIGQSSDKMLRKLEQRRHSNNNILQTRSDSFADDEMTFSGSEMGSQNISYEDIPVFEEVNDQILVTPLETSSENFSGQQFLLLTEGQQNCELNDENSHLINESGTYFRLNKHNKNGNKTIYRPDEIPRLDEIHRPDEIYRPDDNDRNENRFILDRYDTSMELKNSEQNQTSSKTCFDQNKQLFYDPLYDELYVQNMQASNDFNGLKTRWRASVNSNNDSAIGSEIDDSDSMTIFVLTKTQSKNEASDHSTKDQIKPESDYENLDTDTADNISIFDINRHENILIDDYCRSPEEIRQWINESILNRIEPFDSRKNTEDSTEKYSEIIRPHEYKITPHSTTEISSKNKYQVTESSNYPSNNLEKLDDVIENYGSTCSDCTNITEKEISSVDNTLLKNEPIEDGTPVDSLSRRTFAEEMIAETESELLETSPVNVYSTIQCINTVTDIENHLDNDINGNLNLDNNEFPMSENEKESSENNEFLLKDYVKEFSKESLIDFGSHKNIQDKYSYRNTFKFIAREFSSEYTPMDVVSENPSIYLDIYKTRENIMHYSDPEPTSYDYRKEWLFLLKCNSSFWRKNPTRNRFESFYFKKYLNDNFSFNTTLILQNGQERSPKMTSYFTRLLEAERLNLLSKCALCEGNFNMKRKERPFSKCFYCEETPAALKNKILTEGNKPVKNIEQFINGTSGKTEALNGKLGIKVQYMVKLPK